MKEDFKQNYSQLIIRSVIVFYSIWLSVLVIDLVSCSTKSDESCDEQRATLLAWLADSPLQTLP